MNHPRRWTVPNLLSALRIGLVPVLLLMALQGQRQAFL
jgi:phosphatidylglycerophosphate synthase